MSKRFLTLATAETIASVAVQTCLTNKFAPIAVVVLDAAGHTVVSKRMDGCSPVGYDKFALAKANTAIITRSSSRSFRDKYTNDGSPAKFCQMLAMVNITQGNMAPFPGGVVIKNSDGEVLGAVGVSGASGDEDEQCALSGVEAAVQGGAL
jgi:uncharacterized protein GlcG (DUF336 family)